MSSSAGLRRIPRRQSKHAAADKKGRTPSKLRRRASSQQMPAAGGKAKQKQIVKSKLFLASPHMKLERKRSKGEATKTASKNRSPRGRANRLPGQDARVCTEVLLTAFKLARLGIGDPKLS